MSEHGPFDSAELKQWAETYGHPEEWAKRAQAAHSRAEKAERDDRALRAERRLEELCKAMDLAARDLYRAGFTGEAREARKALDMARGA